METQSAQMLKPGLLALFLSLICLGAATPVLAQAQNYQDALAEAQQSGEYAKALRLVESEAERGVPEAQYTLGRMYAQGQGVERDAAEAAKWYRKAAEQGLTEARYRLGVAYGDGEGVPQDYVRAYKWVSLASEGGDPQAQAAQRSYEELMSEQQLQQARQSMNESQ